MMTFEEEFPELKDSLLYEEWKDGDGKIVHVDWLHKKDVEEFCLSKQRVREAIERFRKLTDFKEQYDKLVLGEHLAIKIDGKEPADWLLKEFDLEG